MMVAMSATPDPQARARPLALLFTDARGHVVFVDKGFLLLMSYLRAEGLVGVPMHLIMGVDREEAAEILRDVARTGYLHERRIVLHTLSGEGIPVVCSGVATHNQRGEFIGADISFYDAARASPSGETSRAHADVLQERIDQLQVETEKRGVAEDQVILQLYFTAQINMLSVLAARLGGPRVHAALESIVNEAATRMGWKVRLTEGHIILDEVGIPAEGYSTLLDQVASYVSDLIGRAPVMEEMRAVDARISQTAREAADRAGLRRLIASLQGSGGSEG